MHPLDETSDDLRGVRARVSRLGTQGTEGPYSLLLRASDVKEDLLLLGELIRTELSPPRPRASARVPGFVPLLDLVE